MTSLFCSGSYRTLTITDELFWRTYLWTSMVRLIVSFRYSLVDLIIENFARKCTLSGIQYVRIEGLCLQGAGSP